MNDELRTYLKQKPFIREQVIPIVSAVQKKIAHDRQLLSHEWRRIRFFAEGFREISRRRYLDDIKSALELNRGYAAGKIGKTAQYMARYEILLGTEANARRIAEFESGLKYQCLNQQGIFPADNDFYRHYSAFYMEHSRKLDCLGICYYPGELEILKYYQIKNNLIFYPKQEPDRASPNNAANCYLDNFRGKKLLIVCPFAQLLKSRATKEIFERVWSKTGKKWFYPASVDAVEFPYGFSSETHARYPTVLDLLDDIKAKIQSRDFDVALIGAAGLAIPIATHVKEMNKVAIDLGGHLQVLFGVIGKRWRSWEAWKRDYFNDDWIDMPEQYKPKENDVCDRGAYW